MIVGLDIGYGYTKATEGDNIVIFPSVAGDAPISDFDNALIHSHTGDVYEIDGTAWFIGKHAQKHSRNPQALFTRERTRQTDVLKVLMIAALHELEADRVQVCTGLPVEWYGDKQRLIFALQGEHAYKVNGEEFCAHVAPPVVVPQPFGAFFFDLIGQDFSIVRPKYAGDGVKVGVIDVGMYTTDVVLADGLEYVAKNSGSKPLGLHSMLHSLFEGVRDKYGIEYTVHDIDAILRGNRAFIVEGHDKKLSDESFFEEALARLRSEILAFARDRFGNARDYAAVLVSGGGAWLIEDVIREEYAQARVLQTPHLANVQGFYRYGVRKFK